MIALLIALWILVFFKWTNVLSYGILKERTLRSHKWDLNICCGRTDGGGINADIVQHADLPRFVLIDDVHTLPFSTLEFDHVLCSHTLEHVDDPHRFYQELRRVGRQVTLPLPPLWDLTAAFNLREHRQLFLTFRTTHTTLPPYIRLPLAAGFQRLTGGQHIKA
jgi:hypothetical protein